MNFYWNANEDLTTRSLGLGRAPERAEIQKYMGEIRRGALERDEYGSERLMSLTTHGSKTHSKLLM